MIKIVGISYGSLEDEKFLMVEGWWGWDDGFCGSVS